MTDGWQYSSIALIAWLNPSDILEILRTLLLCAGQGVKPHSETVLS
jgi:hypothetical protein